MQRQRRITAALALVLAIVVVVAGSWAWTGTGGVPPEGKAGLLVYAWTETGSARFVPAVLLVALAFFATDRAIDAHQRRRESLCLLVILILSLPTLAIVVESVVKPAAVQPRPSHVHMSEVGLIPDLDAFYRIDKSARRRQLAEQIPEATVDSLAAVLSMHPVVLRHWIHEAGSTFPSAHALIAFVAAALFLGGALAAPTARRRILATLLLMWAIGVSLSRVLLLVHRPVDVGVGAVFGAVIGVLLTVLWWRWARGTAKLQRA